MMNMEDLKDDIVEELAGLSGMTISPCVSTKAYVTIGVGRQEEVDRHEWTLSEDPTKAVKSKWIEKESTGVEVGTVILEGTKLYFKSAVNIEQMFLSDLIDPASFDEAIKKLKHALNVSNTIKMPNGMIFPGMPRRF
jgi:hypothetical protein